MKFSVSQEIFEKFPKLNIVVVVIREADNYNQEKEIDQLLRQEEYHCRNLFQVMKISKHPNINCWRQTYTSFGAGAHNRSSVEALVKRVNKGQETPSINKLVDLYNLVSLKHILPVGGEDLKKIKGNIELILAAGDENFKAINSEEDNPPQKEEVVYVDENNDVLCRRFNWREAEKTKLTKETRNAIIYIEGLPPVKEIEVKESAQDLTRFIKKFCGGEIDLFLVNKNFPQAIF